MIERIRSIVWNACSFYLAPYYSAASLETIDSGWHATYYYANVMIHVGCKGGELYVKVMLHNNRVIEERECRVKSCDLSTTPS